jgi:molybdate transport system ATP-binding protein
VIVPSPNSADPFLSLEDVTLRLYEAILFQNTNWRLFCNQHWAVIGDNGAGKTTLMKALCGQVPVVSGRIRYHFMGDGGARPQDHIAYVSFDDLRTTLSRHTPFYQARWNQGVSDGKMSVSDYLSESHVKHVNPYRVTDTPTDHVAFAAQRWRVIELLDIKNLLPKEIVQLSDGERRKASIARALMGRPQLLILDNPLTGLDQRFRARLTEIIRRLMRGRLWDGMRVIVATPREDEIPPDVTHVMLVAKGAVIAQGPREAVLQRYADRKPGEGSTQEPALHLPQHKAHPRSQPDSQTLVEMKGVNVSYGGTRILRDIDWSVRRGEHWALLGPNGAGKTTLLSLILADHPQAYANHVVLFGQRRGSGESIWEIKRRIGWVAPELHLYYPRDITALQVVGSGFYDSIGLHRVCSPGQRETARHWMKLLDMEDRADVPFVKLSEGQQRLVLLARALVKEPLLLILDEPCQGLDARNRERVRQVVDAVGSHMDTSVIYVTHNVDELPQIITRVLRLDRGKVVERTGRVGPAPIPGTANI